MKRWSNDEVEYLVSFYDKTDFKTLSEKLNRTEGAIRAKCFDLGLIKHDRWTDEEIQYLIDHKDMSVREIAKVLNRSESSVHLKYSRNNIKKSPYYCDYSFFKNIDTEEKAYWLGFIYSDGWISVNEKTNSGCVGIQLQRRDYKHLKKFNKSISGNYKISFGERECSISDRDGLHQFCSIKVYSIDMVNDLISIGINNHKSYDIEIPNIDDCLMRHFLRGYFDGDGCVRIRTNKKNGSRYPSCDITCHIKDMLDDIRTYLYTKHNITSYIYPDKTNYRLYISGNDSNIKFLNLIYKDSKVYLDRKYQIYEQIIQIESQRNCLAS